MRLALVAALCWAAAAGDPPCLEAVGPAVPLSLRPVGPPVAQPCGQETAALIRPAPPEDDIAELSVLDPPDDACCDDRLVQYFGLAILGCTFCGCACLSLYGLWVTLKPGAARSPTVASRARPPTREGDFEAYQNSLVFKSSVVPLLVNNQQHSRSIGSGTPAARSFDGQLRGTSSSYGSHAAPSDTWSPRHSEITPSITLWVYAPPEDRNIDLREEPRIESKRMGQQLKPGNAFWVGETVDSEDGVVFLRIIDGRGWVFDRHPGLGVLCRPAVLLPLRIFPEEDKAGFKVSFYSGSPQVTAVTSQSAINAGLRAQDLIVRVDGAWVREKVHGTAVFKHAIAAARESGRPMELHVFRQEEDATSIAAAGDEGGEEGGDEDETAELTGDGEGGDEGGAISYVT